MSGEWDELETQSLVKAADHQTAQQGKQYRSRQFLIIIILGFCALMTFFKEDLAAVFLMKKEQEEDVQSNIHPSIIEYQKNHATTDDDDDGNVYYFQKKANKEDEKKEEEEFESKDYYDDEDDGGKANNDDDDDDDAEEDDDKSTSSQSPLSESHLTELKKALSDARMEFDQILKDHFGEYTPSIYDRTRLLENIFPSESSISLERMQRRLKIKILQSQLSPTSKTTYTWAVGGHSASAGHGNLFHQSYGAVLERLAAPVFKTLGITFYGKNYGMGGTSSAPEMALCMNAIFGMDLDVLSWDYGMTDGRRPEYYHMWAERAGSHPTNPILFTYSGGGYAKDVYPILEKSGRGGFHMNINEARSRIPSTEAVDLDKIDSYPPYVRYFMCNGHVESGEPCSQKEVKFNLTGLCGDFIYPGQVSWHNGFKDHFLMGSLLASFVVNNFMDVFDEMSVPSNAKQDPKWLRKRRIEDVNSTTAMDDDEENARMPPSMTQDYLDYLLELEKKDKAAFLASPPTSVIGPLGDNVGVENYKYLLRSNTFCHTARLPAESRYNGLVTESGIISPYVHAGRRDYKEEGYKEGKLPTPKPNNNNTSPILMYNIRDSRKVCEYGQIDHKDAFVVRYADNWTTTILPNDSEKKVFHTGKMDSSTTQGIIMLCMKAFDWRSNPADYVSTASMIVNSTSTDGIIVNDVKVTGYVGADEYDCSILKHDDGFSFPASSSGQYKIMFRVPSRYKDGSYYLSSLIVV